MALRRIPHTGLDHDLAPAGARVNASERNAHVLAYTGGGKDDLLLLRRAALLADQLQARLTVLHVLSAETRPQTAEALTGVRLFARSLGAVFIDLPAYSVADGIAQFTAERGVTHIVIGAAVPGPWYAPWRAPLLDELVQRLGSADVYVLSPPQAGE